MEILNKKFNRPVYFKAIPGNSYHLDFTGRKVSGYLAAFGNADEDGDVIIRGAFAKSISEHGPESQSHRKIAYLFGHDPAEPIGRFTSLEENDHGLYFEAEIDYTDIGDRVLHQYQTGTLNQHSIGFSYVLDKLDYDKLTGTATVREVKLWEGSVVAMGANENTPFTGFKGVDRYESRTTLLDEFERRIRLLSNSDQIGVRATVSKLMALAEMAEPGMHPLPPIVEPPVNWDAVMIHILNTKL